MVSVFSLFFATHRSIGRLLGIQYFRSDTWETSRSETSLQFPTFGALWLVGIDYEIGRDEHIRALKTRQTSHTRDINLTQYIQMLVGRRLNIVEIEDFLIRAWLSELIEVYSIAPPSDTEAYVRGIKAMRSFFSLRRTYLPGALKLLWTQFSDFKALRDYLTSLPKGEERVIMLITMLTTIDNSLHNLVSDPRPINQFADMFSTAPVGSISVHTQGRMAICDIVVNTADNPGNSVFGPKGLICPGNRITSSVLKSVADLKRNFVVKVEGTPELRPGAGRKIWNPESVFVTFCDRTEDNSEIIL
jgi:hypothetical protein